MVYRKCPGLCTFVFKTSTQYLLFMLYCAVIWTFGDSLDFFPMLMPKPCSGDFKHDSQHTDEKRGRVAYRPSLMIKRLDIFI